MDRTSGAPKPSPGSLDPYWTPRRSLPIMRVMYAPRKPFPYACVGSGVAFFGFFLPAFVGNGLSVSYMELCSKVSGWLTIAPMLALTACLLACFGQLGRTTGGNGMVSGSVAVSSRLVSSRLVFSPGCSWSRRSRRCFPTAREVPSAWASTCLWSVRLRRSLVGSCMRRPTQERSDLTASSYPPIRSPPRRSTWRRGGGPFVATKGKWSEPRIQ